MSLLQGETVHAHPFTTTRAAHSRPSTMNPRAAIRRLPSCVFLMAVALAHTACEHQPPLPALSVAATAEMPQPSEPLAAACDGWAVRETVVRFGERIKNVSLLETRDVSAGQIREHYGALVTPELLEGWASRPTQAPGRLVPSPWPDHIELRSDPAAVQDGCLIEGEVVYLSTSAGRVHESPEREQVVLFVRPTADGWRIADFENQSAPGTGTAIDTSAVPPPDSAAPTIPVPEAPETVQVPPPVVSVADTRPVPTPGAAPGAADAIRRYYAAIEARDYLLAYYLWAEGSTGRRRTFQQFADGFAETKHVEVTVGEAGAAERSGTLEYVTIPVIIHALTTGDARQTFSGTYTVGRTTSEGAPEEERRWHIHSAKIRAQE